MNPFSIRQAPEFIQREIQLIQEHIAPMLKKSLGFSFISFPLIGFSIINIFFLVAIVPDTAPKMIPIIIYAILGALGFALLKESSIKNKEVHRTGIAFMKKRIETSTDVIDDVKKRYIKSLEQKPQQAINVFCEFLTYEHNRATSRND
ncbi:YwnF family protein [Alkalihalobacillus pseudalcaliphilus]|uniref:YwnF family protein n=1 Tax=Alkalihalobacillus pseudalcaliphilus TaxID=79884 RepID=UPI00064DA9C7|nr:YwnF family protein [Alkalihalobacillus pseudalcaliphilus]KMK76908.1 hypothetical protein AB990_08440 [Alkalihalobacillus pseudalcaliphilus]